MIHFRFREAPEKLRYFRLGLPESDLCLSDPSFGVDVTVRSDPKTLAAVWMGDAGLAAALAPKENSPISGERAVALFRA